MFFYISLVGLVVVLQLGIIATLVRKYVLTRDMGFVWPGIAVIVWPFTRGLIARFFFAPFIRGQLSFYPFSLVNRGQMSVGSFLTLANLSQQLIGFGLLLVAVLYLCKAKNNRDSDWRITR